MQQQQWEEMACECIGTCACVSRCWVHLPFICLTVEAAWVVLGCRVREMIFLSLVSVICLCWFFNQFIELCSRFYWIPRQVKEWGKEWSLYRKRKKDGEVRVKGKSVSSGLLVYFSEANGTVKRKKMHLEVLWMNLDNTTKWDVQLNFIQMFSLFRKVYFFSDA